MICSIEDCQKETRSRNADLCEKHYYRRRRTGTTSDPVRRPESCTVADCNHRDVRRDGLCRMHHLRLSKHGDVDYSMPGSPWLGDQVGYAGAHIRLRKTRGRASDRACVDCKSPAQQWSYNHAAEDERIGTRGYPYSLDPNEYSPRCVPCHKAFDLSRL